MACDNASCIATTVLSLIKFRKIFRYRVVSFCLLALLLLLVKNIIVASVVSPTTSCTRRGKNIVKAARFSSRRCLWDISTTNVAFIRIGRMFCRARSKVGGGGWVVGGGWRICTAWLAVLIAVHLQPCYGTMYTVQIGCRGIFSSQLCLRLSCKC